MRDGPTKGGVYIIEADDLTAPDNKNYLPPGQPAAQTLSEYSQAATPQWLVPPDDLSLRLLWGTGKQAFTPTNTFAWRDARNGAWETTRPITVVDNGVGAYFSVKFSPDRQQALFALVRPSQYLDGCHDLARVDLRSGTTQRLRDYLFGHSEIFSPDGKRIALISGSLDTILGSPVADPLMLDVIASDAPYVPSVLSSQGFYTNNRLDRTSLAWTKSGDLIVGSSIVSGHYQAYGNEQEKLQQVILSFKNASGKKTIWQTRASSPLPSPDGKHIAFIGPEQAPDGNWRDISPAINIARDDGTQRHTLTRISDRTPQMFWSPDGTTLYLWDFYTSVEIGSTYGALKKLSKTIPVELSLTAYDIESGVKRNLAKLETDYRRRADYDIPSLEKFAAFGVTSNGKYLLFHRVEYKSKEKADSSSWIKLAADSLHAIRLSDGKLITLAVLDQPLEAAPQ